MGEIWIIVKHSIRILLRNRAFLFFIVVLPVLSILLLNMKDFSDGEIKADQNQIYIMKKMSERICYDAKNTMLPVKIYDSTDSELGFEFVKQLEMAGLFQVFYCDTRDQQEDAIQKDIKRCSMNDKISGIVLLRDTFESELINGEISIGVIYYNSNMDERTKLLEHTISQILGSFLQIANTVDTKDDLAKQIQVVNKSMPTVINATVLLDSEDDLSQDMKQQMQMIGYFIAIATISYLFSGVLIADTVIKERNYKVYNRFQLTDLTPAQYIIAKYIVGVITVLLQTGVVGIAMQIILKRPYAITNLQLLINIAVIGLIFNSMTLCIGIICNDVMNTNYMAFVIWSVSSMLSGCYFDLSDAGRTIRGISNLMPQRWAIETVRMIMKGQSGAYMVLLVTAVAFLVVIGSFGVMGTIRSIQES